MSADDLVIQELADSEAELREAVATYRELFIAAVDALRDLTVTHAREREQYRRLREEHRMVLERIMLGIAA